MVAALVTPNPRPALPRFPCRFTSQRERDGEAT